MSRELWPYKTSRVVKATHPIDAEAQNPLDNTTDGSTCTFKVYDPGVDESISVAEASGQTVLSVSNAGVFAVGHTIEVIEDDDSILATSVTVVNTVTGEITVANALTNGCAIGQRVRRIFGTAITMTEFGTPSLNTTDWGFRGTYPSDHVSQILNQDLNIEISFVGAVAGGLDVLETLCVTITQECA